MNLSEDSHALESDQILDSVDFIITVDRRISEGDVGRLRKYSRLNLKFDASTKCFKIFSSNRKLLFVIDESVSLQIKDNLKSGINCYYLDNEGSDKKQARIFIFKTGLEKKRIGKKNLDFYAMIRFNQRIASLHIQNRNIEDAMRQLMNIDQDLMFEMSKNEDLKTSVSEYYFRIAYCLTELKRFQEAVKVLKQAISINRTNSYFYCEIGYNFSMLGEFDSAISSYKLALAVNDSIYVAHKCVGFLLLDQKKYKEAASAFRNALAKFPDRENLYLGLVMAYHGLGYKQLVVKILERVNRIFKANSNFRYHLAVAYYEVGETSKAIGEFREVVRLCPGSEIGQMSQEAIAQLDKFNFNNVYLNYLKLIALKDSRNPMDGRIWKKIDTSVIMAAGRVATNKLDSFRESPFPLAMQGDEDLMEALGRHLVKLVLCGYFLSIAKKNAKLMDSPERRTHLDEHLLWLKFGEVMDEIKGRMMENISAPEFQPGVENGVVLPSFGPEDRGAYPQIVINLPAAMQFQASAGVVGRTAGGEAGSGEGDESGGEGRSAHFDEVTMEVMTLISEIESNNLRSAFPTVFEIARDKSAFILMGIKELIFDGYLLSIAEAELSAPNGLVG